MFSFDSYIGKKMSQSWLRGWFYLLTQIVCVDGGRVKQNAIKWGNVPCCTWVLTLQTATSSILIYELLGLQPALQRCRCVCTCTKTLIHHRMSTSDIYVILAASVEKTAKSDCWAQIMVVTIMVTYYLFGAWQCSRCISSFNLLSTSGVDIYNLYYNNLREAKWVPQL